MAKKEGELEVFGGSMIGVKVDGKYSMRQVRAIMASETKKRFLLASGNDADFVSETGNDEELAVALAKPGALFVNIGDQGGRMDAKPGKAKSNWIELPESAWSHQWSDAIKKRARSITRVQFLLLKHIRMLKTAPNPAKVEPLIDLGLVVRLPDNLKGPVYNVTEKGALLCEHTEEKGYIDVEEAARFARYARDRILRAAENKRQEAIDAAKDAIVQVARDMLMQKATMDDLEMAVGTLERAERR